MGIRTICHCERSDAIQRLWICFWMAASAFILLAMTNGAYAQEDASFEVLCRSLPNYQPAHGNQGADYVPGVDVSGKPVVPADMNGLDGGMPDVVNVPITLYLAERFNLNLADGISLEPNVGALQIRKDGSVSFNGQDVTQRAYSVCAKDVRIPMGTRAPAPAQEPVKVHNLPVEPAIEVPQDGEDSQ